MTNEDLISVVSEQLEMQVWPVRYSAGEIQHDVWYLSGYDAPTLSLVVHLADSKFTVEQCFGRSCDVEEGIEFDIAFPTFIDDLVDFVRRLRKRGSSSIGHTRDPAGAPTQDTGDLGASGGRARC